MFRRIKEFFEGKATLEVDRTGEPTGKDLQIATAVLLLEMAGADEDYAPEEVKSCFAAFQRQFDVEDDETLRIFESAEQLREEKGKIDEFVQVINERFNDRQKQIIMAMIWRIVIADEVVENYEQRFASQLRTRLQLSREQAEAAKDLALEGAV
ncbi:MAG: TerB family tellurite resistance protein [Bdellovibrionales bacterium]|nr:TerB family tellurite resistance protein [Bdellovibrionales bacterium]